MLIYLSNGGTADKMKELLINSKRLEEHKDKIIKTAEEILDAIKEKRPVWIRHHNDCDGYCSAIALEKAIQKNMYDILTRESDFFFYYKRFPSRTPYYSYADATKDISIMLTESERFSRKTPLIIVVDNGSSKEDLMALKKLNIYGLKPIVIDHHPMCKENDQYVSIHLNTGKSDLPASILSAEVANILGGVNNPELYAITGAIGDKSEAEELGEYLKIAKEKGYDEGFFHSAAQAIDYEVNSLGNMEARQYVQDLIFGDFERMKEIIGIVEDEIKKEQQIVESISMKYLTCHEASGHIVASIDTENFFNLKGLSNSKVTGIAKKKLEEVKRTPVVMLGYASDIITVRVNKDLDFDMNKLKKYLESEFPYSMMSGGGHAKAGSIHFSKHLRDEILNKALQYFMEAKKC